MAMVRLQCALGLHLRRLDPAGSSGRQGHHRSGRVRGRGPAPGRQPQRRGAGRDRARRLPQRGCLRRASSPPTRWPASSEAIGLALPNSSGAPAPVREPRPVWRGLGRGGDESCSRLRLPPAADIVTRIVAGKRRPASVACTGGSTNAGLHLPAIAHEAGIAFDLFDVCEIFKGHALFRRHRSPAANTSPRIFTRSVAFRWVMKELRKIGLIHEECITVTGRNMGRGAGPDRARGRWQGVIHPAATPITPTGGVRRPEGPISPPRAPS